MASISQKIIFRGLSKAELAELQDILGIEPDIVNVMMKDGELVVVEHPPEHKLGEPLTWAAIWVLAKNTKVGARATGLLDKIFKSRQAIVVKRSITLRRPGGEIETVDVSIEARGDAVDELLKKLGRDALALDTRHTASSTTIELAPDRSRSETLAPTKPKDLPGSVAKAKQARSAKATTAAVTKPKAGVTRNNRRKGAAKPRGKTR